MWIVSTTFPSVTDLKVALYSYYGKKLLGEAVDCPVTYAMVRSTNSTEQSHTSQI